MTYLLCKYYLQHCLNNFSSPYINYILMYDFQNTCWHCFWHWYSNINLEVLFSLLVFLHTKFCIFISEHCVPTRDFFKLFHLFFRSYSGQCCILHKAEKISDLPNKTSLYKNGGGYLKQSSPSLVGVFICPAANQNLSGLTSGPQLNHVCSPFR